MTDASRGLVDREVLVDTVALAAVAREHVLVVGPPGTAKSEAVRRAARALGGRMFEYLLGRFTEPNEVFGPVDLGRLREGAVEIRTEGMLPEAEIAFLDEVFLGSTAILNTLLGILNERVFRRGHTTLQCPLRVCVAAANRLPEDDALAAFADRFLLRVFVDAVPESRLEDLLEGGRALQASGASSLASIHAIDVLSEAARQVDLTAVRPRLAEVVRALRGASVRLTDRRIVKVQSLVAAAAVMAGRTEATIADLWPVVLAVPTHEEQVTARDALASLLTASENPALAGAVLAASGSLAARAERLVRMGEEALAARPQGDDEKRAHRLRLESIVREIDATFAPQARPPAIEELREQIRGAL